MLKINILAKEQTYFFINKIKLSKKKLFNRRKSVKGYFKKKMFTLKKMLISIYARWLWANQGAKTK